MVSKLKILLKNKIYFLFGFLVCFIIGFLIVTYGSGNIFQKESFGCFFDEQAISMLKGRLDVPYDAIRQEAFVYNKLYFGYFGITSSVLRLPLLFIKSLKCRWSELFMFIFYLLNIYIAYLFYKKIRKFKKSNLHFDLLYILFIGLGTSTIYLMSRSFTYHETLLVGSFFSLLSYYYLLDFSLNIKFISLNLSIIFAAFSLNARIPMGLGNLFSISIIIFLNYLFHFFASLGYQKQWRQKIIKIKLLFISTLLFISVIFFSLSINFIKFNNFLAFIPIQYNISYINNPKRLSKISKQSFVNSQLLLHNLKYYFGWGGISTTKLFPWIIFDGSRKNIPTPSTIDMIEPNASLLMTNPLLYISIVIGLAVVFFKKSYKKFCFLILGSLTTLLITSSAVSVSERYFQDFFSFFVIAGSIGYAYMSSFLYKKKMLTLFFLILVIYSIYINIFSALTYQRKLIWGVPISYKNDYINIQRKITGYLNKIKKISLRTVITEGELIPEDILPGEKWQFGDNAFLFNGVYFIPTSLNDANIHYRQYSVNVLFNKDLMEENQPEPLISESLNHRGSFTQVVKRNGKLFFIQKNLVNVFFDDVRYIISNPIDFPKKAVTINVLYDRYSNRLVIKLDDKTLLDSPFEFDNLDFDKYYIGEDKDNVLSKKSFSGKIIKAFLNNNAVIVKN